MAGNRDRKSWVTGIKVKWQEKILVLLKLTNHLLMHSNSQLFTIFTDYFSHKLFSQ